MKLSNILYILPAVQARYQLTIYAPEYAKDIMQVVSREEVQTYANTKWQLMSRCISAKLQTGSTCDLTPMFYPVASFSFWNQTGTIPFNIKMPGYELEVSLALATRSS
jgi:hypothetical protein